MAIYEFLPFDRFPSTSSGQAELPFDAFALLTYSGHYVLPQAIRGTGGGGIRTPVPRCFKTSVYMLSRLIVFFTLPSAKTTGS